ncbi:exocyst complex subunit 4 [Pelomyxa schiedti]|nr:exocyst complex subunit 4 [Pelomyxa schiedti]
MIHFTALFVTTTLVLLQVIGLAPRGLVEAACDGKNCSACVYSNGGDATCGWCADPAGAYCTKGNRDGPLVGTCPYKWHHLHSQVYWVDSGFPVHPFVSYVYLHPNDPLDVPIELLVPSQDDQALDLMFTYDQSYFMGDDLSTFAMKLVEMIAEVIALRKNSAFGLSSFIEKPVGDNRVDGANWPYKLFQVLQKDFTGLQAQLLNLDVYLTAKSNANDALEGMLFSSCPATQWREEAIKVLIMATSSEYEDNTATSLPANNYDCTPDCVTPPCDWSGIGHLPGDGENYPDPDLLAPLFLRRNIFPVFLVNNEPTSNSVDETLQWKALQASWGFGLIVILSADSGNLVESVKYALAYITSRAEIFIIDDPLSYVEDTKPHLYTNLTEQKTYLFYVNLTSVPNPQNCYIQLVVLGWGKSNINVTNHYPCLDCTGVPNGPKVNDLCGKCGGTNACVDCAGTPYGFLIYDECGVCDGNSSTCLDCAGQVITGDDYAYEDFCGVCDTDSYYDNATCTGCDGVPSLNPTTYDLCGVCGGNNTCMDCTHKPYGPYKLDLCGICGGDNSSCMGCDGSFELPLKNYDTCGVCGGSDDCYDCFLEAWGTAVVVCGVCNGPAWCVGCDNKTAFPPLQYDVCNVCGGDGSSCRGCDGSFDMSMQYDLCGLCGGANDTCVGCDGVMWSEKYYDACGECGGDDGCLGKCDRLPWSGNDPDLCGECFVYPPNQCYGCDGVKDSGLTYDVCGNCGAESVDCFDCFGVQWSPWIVDKCGICNGTDLCIGCDGLPYGYQYDICGNCGAETVDCLECGVLWGPPPDLCGECGGNNTCLDCLGEPYGSATYDRCGICNNGTIPDLCVGCDDVPFSGLDWDGCGICGGDNHTCTGCDGKLWSGLTYDACGICGGYSECKGCDGKYWSVLDYDDCGICGGSNECYGCDSVAFSGKTYDLCGDCDSIPDKCLGVCDGIPYSTAVFDACFVCGGDNSSCLSCDGIPWGTLTYNECGECAEEPSCLACDGTPWNTNNVYEDRCGVCGGYNDCVGCDDAVYIDEPVKQYDNCGECGGDNSCLGCDSIAWSVVTYDHCGVCGGQDDCIGCDGKTFSGLTYDKCGVCGGDSGCLGCDFVPFSNRTVDDCGVCGGNNECIYYDACGLMIGTTDCFGCDNVAWSGLVVDACGICGGNGTSCAGCDGVAFSGAIYDECGQCNGQSDCYGCDGLTWSGATADACGMCMGNATDASICNPAPVETALIATGSIIGGVLLAVGAAIAAFFGYARWAKGANWYIPNQLLDDTKGTVIDNVLYEPNKAADWENNEAWEDPKDKD